MEVDLSTIDMIESMNDLNAEGAKDMTEELLALALAMRMKRIGKKVLQQELIDIVNVLGYMLLTEEGRS